MAWDANLEMRETDAGVSLTSTFSCEVETRLASGLHEHFAKRTFEPSEDNVTLLAQHNFEEPPTNTKATTLVLDCGKDQLGFMASLPQEKDCTPT